MHEGNVEAVQTATRRSPQPRQLFLGDSITRGPMSEARPVWLGCQSRAAQGADWPRLVEAWGSLGHGLAPNDASGEPAGPSLCLWRARWPRFDLLVFDTGAASRRTEAPAARRVARPPNPDPNPNLNPNPSPNPHPNPNPHAHPHPRPNPSPNPNPDQAAELLSPGVRATAFVSLLT